LPSGGRSTPLEPGEPLEIIGQVRHEHQHRVERWPPAFATGTAAQCRYQRSAENFEIHHGRQPLQRIASSAQRLISVRKIEETWLSCTTETLRRWCRDPATKGEPSWPPLAMFKALLLSIWYYLSDVKLVEAPDDRASFRPFCGFAGNEATLERTAFFRLRGLPVADQLALLWQKCNFGWRQRASALRTMVRWRAG